MEALAMNDFVTALAQYAARKSIDKAGETLQRKANRKKGCMGCGCVVPILLGFFVLVYMLQNSKRPSSNSLTERTKVVFAKDAGQ